ncbi:MAG: DegV family EDD domain-containing protein, partial [FCB group bacterium]|nr:DegV family EDD domain-containing protein [FCB group bacterium]
DNTCQLEPDRIKELGLEHIDYPLYLNGEPYAQTWDAPNWRAEKDKFIDLLRDKKNRASTSGIPEEEFQKTFERFKDEEILLITQSHNNTRATRDALRNVLKSNPQYDVMAFDTEILASGVGAQALAMLLEKEEKGLNRKACYALLEKNRANAHVVGVLYDLFYLNRSGRIGLAKAAIATAMGVYPMLSSTPQSGVLKSVGKVRNFTQANLRFLATIKQQMLEKNSRRLTVNMAYVNEHDKECLHMKNLLEKTAAELGWDLHVDINYSNFSLLPHMGPDFYEMGYVIGI